MWDNGTRVGVRAHVTSGAVCGYVPAVRPTVPFKVNNKLSSKNGIYFSLIPGEGGIRVIQDLKSTKHNDDSILRRGVHDIVLQVMLSRDCGELLMTGDRQSI